MVVVRVKQRLQCPIYSLEEMLLCKTCRGARAMPCSMCDRWLMMDKRGQRPFQGRQCNASWAWNFRSKLFCLSKISGLSLWQWNCNMRLQKLPKVVLYWKQVKPGYVLGWLCLKQTLKFRYIIDDYLSSFSSLVDVTKFNLI